jgi:four helix bundle protein
MDMRPMNETKKEDGRRTKETTPPRAGAGKRAPIRSFRDLEVYQRAQTCMARVHKMVLAFPRYEERDLVDQLRRSSKAVGAPIAEGWALRASEKHFKLYLRRALGETNETESHIDTARVLEYLSVDAAESLIGEYQILANQLHQLIQNWKTYPSPSSSILPPSSRRNAAIRTETRDPDHSSSVILPSSHRNGDK